MTISLNDAFTVFQSPRYEKSCVFPQYSAHKRSFSVISDILISPPSSMFANPERGSNTASQEGRKKSWDSKNIPESEHRTFAIKFANISVNASQTFDMSLSAAAKRLTINKLKLCLSIQRTPNKLFYWNVFVLVIPAHLMLLYFYFWPFRSVLVDSWCFGAQFAFIGWAVVENKRIFHGTRAWICVM